MSSASDRTVEQMEQDLRELIQTIQSPQLGLLLERLLGPDSAIWPRFRDAPAAKRYHHAYRHGLLDHTLTVAQAVSALSAIFAGVNRDIALSGEEIEMTDAGRLHGEIALGYARVRDEIERID